MNSLNDKHFFPIEVADIFSRTAAGAQPGGENKHRVVAFEHLVDAADGVAALRAVLVDGEEYIAKWFDCHKKVVDKEIDFSAITTLEEIDQSHAVKTAEGMVGADDDSPLRMRGKKIFVFDIDGDTKVVEYTAAEIGTTPREIVAQKPIEVLLTDCAFEFADKHARDKASLRAKSLADNSGKVNLNRFVFG